MGAQYIHGSNSGHHNNSLTPSKGMGGKGQHIMSPNGAMGGLHGLNNLNIGGRGNTDGGGSHHLGVNNSKTPKEAYKRIQGIGGAHVHDRNGLSSDDRLNLSVDIAGRQGGQASS